MTTFLEIIDVPVQKRILLGKRSSRVLMKTARLVRLRTKESAQASRMQSSMEKKVKKEKKEKVMMEDLLYTLMITHSCST